MAREIPEVVRAAAGLAATVLDEARKLPETLPGLPVRVIGLAMQQAMKAQQTYAGFVARGDELFTGLRGEDEPGLATFDDDEPVAAPAGFRDSAFDRAGDIAPTSASPDLIVDDEIEASLRTIEEFTEEAPDTEAILDEIAIDELVDQAPALEETAPAKPAKRAKAAKAAKPVKATKPRKAAKAAAKPAEETPSTGDAAAEETALLEATLAASGTADSAGAETTAEVTFDAEPTADVATTVDVLTPAVDVLTPAGDVETVEATVTDEGVAAPEAPAEDTMAAAAETPTAETSTAPADELAISTDTAGSTAPTSAPIDGYDSFSIAQLRGRLRGYALITVQDLVAYEQATQARAPYLTMLRNRLEKLEEQAIESSPLAPRGA
jgi:hypothetical protein